jgi:hypothetical protein
VAIPPADSGCAQVLDGSARDAVEKIGGELFAIVHRPELVGALTD